MSSIKSEIENLIKEIESAKNGYSSALKKLESISEEIHEKRNTMMKREPCVGAEDNHSSFNNENICDFKHLSILDEEVTKCIDLIEDSDSPQEWEKCYNTLNGCDIERPFLFCQNDLDKSNQPNIRLDGIPSN